jgi:hypothetical protein
MRHLPSLVSVLLLLQGPALARPTPELVLQYSRMGALEFVGIFSRMGRLDRACKAAQDLQYLETLGPRLDQDEIANTIKIIKSVCQ